MRAFCFLLFVAMALGCQKPPETPATADSEHAVFVTLRLSDSEFGTAAERDAIRRLTDELDAAIRAAGAGEYDGDEYGGGSCTLYMYGADADVLFSVVEPILRESSLVNGGEARKRYGEASDPNAREVVVKL